MALLDSLSGYATGRTAAAPARHATAPADIPVSVAPPSPVPAPGTMGASQPVLTSGFVTDLVEQWDKRPELSRDGGTDGYMHVSSLIGLDCARKPCLVRQHDVQTYNTVTGGHRLMWAQGRATENHIRDAIISSTDGRIMYGRWVCRCEHASHLGLRPDQDFKCERCGHSLDRYREPLLRDDEYLITGNPDLTFLIENHILVTEIKSMNEDQFEELDDSALADHANQALMYREMYRRKGFRVMDKVVVLYGRKRFKWGGKGRVYKEFHVDATTLQSRTMVDTCYDIASDIAANSRAQALPRRCRGCATPETKTAKGCPVAHLCFSMRSE